MDKWMIDKIGEPAMLEQLAEECTELAKAALKKARILRKENPTPVTLADADMTITEEFSDVFQCAIELDLHADKGILEDKRQRFMGRWERARNH